MINNLEFWYYLRSCQLGLTRKSYIYDNHDFGRNLTKNIHMQALFLAKTKNINIIALPHVQLFWKFKILYFFCSSVIIINFPLSWPHQVMLSRNVLGSCHENVPAPKVVQSLTKAIIFELFYYLNGYFRV